VVDALYGRLGARAQPVRNFVHGTWLGHPLHPVLTDVPLGCWTAAFVLDLLPATRRQVTPAIAIGVAGALASAVTGATDWRYTDGVSRRTGLVHGMLNLCATMFYIASLGLRLAGRSGRAASFAGFGTAMFAAYLGGNLVYDHRVGTRHAAHQPPPEDFVAVLPYDQLPRGEVRRVEVSGLYILLARVEDEVFALTDICTHLGCSLALGQVRDRAIACICHGSRFDLRDGRVLDGPAVFPETSLEVRIRDGQIEVRRR
jgi:nitrite reductase/ring-hydroxylating ferredoxin subunit/uncharacterized membrane protein